MPHICVGSHTIYYDDHGSGQPLLLIPGLSNSRLIWWKQAGVFSKKYHLIEMDNRDAGDSSLGTGPYSIGDMADDAAGLIRNLDLGAMNVIGWSMGGFISLELAVRNPELVNRLMLVATSAGGSDYVQPSSEIQAILMPTPGMRILKHACGTSTHYSRDPAIWNRTLKTWIKYWSMKRPNGCHSNPTSGSCKQ